MRLILFFIVVLVFSMGNLAWGQSAEDYYRKGKSLYYAKHQPAGKKYFYRNGDKKDQKKAAKFFRKASKMGSAYGQFYLAWCYEEGTGVKKSLEKAAHWYIKAAKGGCSSAYARVGDLYYEGKWGILRDDDKAFKWFKKSADNGSYDGYLGLGKCYQYARGVRRNPAEAKKWYRKILDAENAKLYSSYKSASYHHAKMYPSRRRNVALESIQTLANVATNGAKLLKKNGGGSSNTSASGAYSISSNDNTEVTVTKRNSSQNCVLKIYSSDNEKLKAYYSEISYYDTDYGAYTTKEMRYKYGLVDDDLPSFDDNYIKLSRADVSSSRPVKIKVQYTSTDGEYISATININEPGEWEIKVVPD